MPVAWAFGAAMWVAHLQFQLDELFFSETTHTHTHTHFGMFVLWSFFEANGSRFWKGSLDGCPQLFSTFISQSLGAQTIFAQLFLHIFPPVSCGSLVHIVPVWMGCLHACSTVICVCSPGFLWGVAQLSAIIVFCSQLCLKFVSQYLRFFVLQSSESVRSVRCVLRNTSRNVLWKVSPNVIYSIWNQSQSLAIFLSIVVNVSLQNEHTQRKQYTRTTPLCKRSIMVFFGLISGVQFRVPSYFILFPSLDGKIEVDVQRQVPGDLWLLERLRRQEWCRSE